MLGLTPDMSKANEFSELGVILLLFVIGLELSPQRLWLMRRAVFGAGLLQVVLSALALGGVALAFNSGWQSALVIGLGARAVVDRDRPADPRRAQGNRPAARAPRVRDPAVPGSGRDSDSGD